MAAEWDPELNGDLTPSQVSAYSNKRANWQCSTHGHRWDSVIASRVAGVGCPICSGKRVLIGFNDLASQRPEIAREWDYASNAGRTPDQFTVGASARAHWKCYAHGHAWEAVIYTRTRPRGAGCPVCANKRVLVGFNDLASTHPDLAREWDSERNGSVTPFNVTASSHATAHWECALGHRWTVSIENRGVRGHGCAVCSGKRVLPGFNDLATLNKELAAEWDLELNDGLLPTQVAAFSQSSAVWKCAPHSHQWRATIASRSAGCGCPVCAGKRVIAGFNDLATLEPRLSQEWDMSRNSGRLPSEFTTGSHHRASWVCSTCVHSWEATIKNRTKGRGCPKCCVSQTSRIEQAFFDALSAVLEGASNGSRIPVSWGTQKASQIDILGAYRGREVVVEYDGSFYHSKKVRADFDKTEALLGAGYLVVRIRENSLAHLSISSNQLLQLRHDYRDLPANALAADVAPTVAKIVAWLSASVAAKAS